MPRGLNTYDELRLQRRVDPDAEAYLSAVERVENQSVENGVKVAVNEFVAGCKIDGIWGAIKACCILSGARTLTGALVPLVGAAPTNNNFVAADYDRKLGPIGNGTTKYISSNRNGNADPQNSQHLVAWVSVSGTQASTTGTMGGGTSQISNLSDGRYFIRSQSATSSAIGTAKNAAGFHGISRNSSSNCNAIVPSIPLTNALNSETPTSATINVFGRSASPYFNGRISFYSIGENLNLSLFGARVSALMESIKREIV